MINIRSSNIIKKCALVTILAFSIFSSNLSAKTVEKTISLIDKRANNTKSQKSPSNQKQTIKNLLQLIGMTVNFQSISYQCALLNASMGFKLSAA